MLRTGGTARTLGGVVKAPSTLGTFLRSFRWGHVRQLDRVSRELLARAWSAGAGFGPFTIDWYLRVRSGQGFTATRARGAITRCLRRIKGRANTARGAAHFLRETVGHAGARGQLTSAGRQRLHP